MRSRRRAKLTALLAGLGIGLSVAELLVHALCDATEAVRVPHPTRGVVCVPDSSTLHRGEGRRQRLHYNGRGFRDGERTVPKPAGVFRIAVLGDSYVEAPQVAREDRLTEKLEKYLNEHGGAYGRRVEVINFGVSGYGTMQELQTLREEVWEYQPDLVIVALLTGNDFQNNCRELRHDRGRPYLCVDGLGFRELVPGSGGGKIGWHGLIDYVRNASATYRLWRGVVAQLVEQRIRRQEAAFYGAPGDRTAVGFEAGLNAAVYLPPRDAAWEQAWVVTEELLRRVNTECVAHGVNFVLVVLSNGIQVHPDASVRTRFAKSIGTASLLYPEERLTTAAGRDGYGIMCLAPELRKVAERDHVFLHGFENAELGFGHWNERGHAEAARVVGDFLTARWQHVR